MTLEELKALLDSGKITQEQYDDLAAKLDDTKGDDGKDDEKKDGIDDELLEKKIQQAVDRATNKLGNDNKTLREQLDKLKKEKLTNDELKALEDEEKNKALTEREQAVKDAENKLYAVKAIKKAGLDDGSETALDILSIVNGDSEETIDANIKSLKALVDKLVKAEVEKTFKSKGRVPEKGADGTDGDNPYLASAFNLTKQMELEASNPELASKYKLAAGVK